MSDYYFFIHPDTGKTLLEAMTPKQRWQIHYRSERLKRQGKILCLIQPEIGRLSGFKIIQGDRP